MNTKTLWRLTLLFMTLLIISMLGAILLENPQEPSWIFFVIIFHMATVLSGVGLIIKTTGGE